MSELQISQPQSSEPEPCSESNAVCESWQQLLQGVLACMLLLGALAMFHYYAPRAPQETPQNDLQQQVHELNAQIQQLKQEQAMPAMVLNRYRNSIGYIYGVYQVGYANQRPAIRARVSGTGFLAGERLIATNRHVAEPWYGDSEAEALMKRGASATLESLVIFFPGSPTPVNLEPAAVSKTFDLAILRAQDLNLVSGLPILPLAKSPSSPG